MARGRKQIHEWAFGTEMAGLEHWVYPYVRTLIDDQRDEAAQLGNLHRNRLDVYAIDAVLDQV